MTIGTRLFTFFRGEFVGADSGGSRYYRDKKRRPGERERRWVMYAGAPEASTVPPEWHGWLHYTVEDFPRGGGRAKRPWQKEHVPNLTGTPAAYRPPGHVLKEGRRAATTGDYEPWEPN